MPAELVCRPRFGVMISVENLVTHALGDDALRQWVEYAILFADMIPQQSRVGQGIFRYDAFLVFLSG